MKRALAMIGLVALTALATGADEKAGPKDNMPPPGFTALFNGKDGKNTLVIVTADHGQSSQIVYPDTTTPGLTRTLLTADGKPMTIAYGTADTGGAQDHTGTQVRIAAYGPYAGNVVGLTDQTDLFATIRDALGLDPTLQSPTASLSGR